MYVHKHILLIYIHIYTQKSISLEVAVDVDIKNRFDEEKDEAWKEVEEEVEKDMYL
jgi:hypothetical protein